VAAAEVARAANVSTETVFNCFPRKEDLYFDRRPQAKALISQALERRALDETSPHALREPVKEAESAVRADISGICATPSTRSRAVPTPQSSDTPPNSPADGANPLPTSTHASFVATGKQTRYHRVTVRCQGARNVADPSAELDFPLARTKAAAGLLTFTSHHERSAQCTLITSLTRPPGTPPATPPGS
jgi:AcrR family transcriptional regulator